MKKGVRTFALCLILIVMVWALVFPQVGADKRPTPPPKKSLPKMPPKRTTTRTTSPDARSKPRQSVPDIAMIYVQGGTFMMGSPNGEGESEERPQHQVTVRDFFIGKYEVTQAQYWAVMGTNPSNFKGDNRPVENVDWHAAVEFCKRLSQMTGRDYRLPTEAEWEYAARAGTTGDYAGNLDSMAWYRNNSGGQTHPVGQKQPNRFGLYDIYGNVPEWCEDTWHDNYNGAPTNGSAWVSEGEGSHVLRGGLWGYGAEYCRSAYRTWHTPDPSLSPFGFRVVAVLRSS